MQTGSEGSEHFQCSPFGTLTYDPVKMKLLESKVEAEEPSDHAAWN